MSSLVNEHVAEVTQGATGSEHPPGSDNSGHDDPSNDKMNT
jgi:hypothetical protein